MGAEKKLIRKNFRDSCYKRDKYKCAKCSYAPVPSEVEKELDANHITDRNLMPNGGYAEWWLC